VEVTIEPFKGLLLGLFFMTVGAGLDVARVFADPLQTLGVAAALTAAKTIIIYGLVRLARFTHASALESALVNAPAGEFAFVILGAAAAGGLLNAGLAAQLTLAATLSMLAIPALAWFGARRRRPQQAALAQYDALAPAVELSNHVIVVGYGRVGSLVGDMLATHKIPAIAIDGDAKLVAAEAQRRLQTRRKHLLGRRRTHRIPAPLRPRQRTRARGDDGFAQDRGAHRGDGAQGPTRHDDRGARPRRRPCDPSL